MLMFADCFVHTEANTIYTDVNLLLRRYVGEFIVFKKYFVAFSNFFSVKLLEIYNIY